MPGVRDGIVLPEAEGGGDVARLVTYLEAETQHGLPVGITTIRSGRSGCSRGNRQHQLVAIGSSTILEQISLGFLVAGSPRLGVCLLRFLQQGPDQRYAPFASTPSEDRRLAIGALARPSASR
jgi:hypothetical protein